MSMLRENGQAYAAYERLKAAGVGSTGSLANYGRNEGPGGGGGGTSTGTGGGGGGVRELTASGAAALARLNDSGQHKDTGYSVLGATEVDKIAGGGGGIAASVAAFGGGTGGGGGGGANGIPTKVKRASYFSSPELLPPDQADSTMGEATATAGAGAAGGTGAAARAGVVAGAGSTPLLGTTPTRPPPMTMGPELQRRILEGMDDVRVLQTNRLTGILTCLDKQGL